MWVHKSRELWEIIREYHKSDYGNDYPVIRCTLNIELKSGGTIDVMRGSKDDCFTQTTILSEEESVKLFSELNKILEHRRVQRITIRVAPDEVPEIIVKYYLTGGWRSGAI